MSRVAVVGLGEAGAIYARGLRDAGFDVTGYDPFIRLGEPGITQSEQLADVLSAADLVITLVGAKVAATMTNNVLDHLAPGTLLADFNTASPELMSTLGAAAATTQDLVLPRMRGVRPRVRPHAGTRRGDRRPTRRRRRPQAHPQRVHEGTRRRRARKRRRGGVDRMWAMAACPDRCRIRQ